MDAASVYTESAWAEEMRSFEAGELLHCPDCGRSLAYEPRAGEGPVEGGPIRKYRACKICGFWQEADGESSSYRCVITFHLCLAAIPDGAQCTSCTVEGPLSHHLCGRYLRESETYVHESCGTLLGPDHVVPWPP